MRDPRTIAIMGVVCIFIWSCLPGTGAAGAKVPRSVTFLPQWSPQAQFAGFYVAEAKGFYKRHGLDVTVLRGGPERPAGAGLVKGEADFVTLFMTEGLALRDRGVPLVNVGQIVQKSALMLVARKSSGIREPGDFHGRRVSVWDNFRLQPVSFFQQNQADVTIVSQGYTQNLFLMGGVDAASAMWYNEYYNILNSGINADELTTFLLADYGLNFPEDGIYCLEETLQTDPEMVKAFVQGSVEGWHYAFDHPDETLEIVMARVNAANLPTNRVHQKWMQERMEDIIQPEESTFPMGTLTRKDFLFVAEHLRQNGIIQTIPEYMAFHAPL